MLRLACCAGFAFGSILTFAACSGETVTDGSSGSGGAGAGGSASTSSTTHATATTTHTTGTASTTTGSGGGTVACEDAGGTCVPLVPDACANGTVGDANHYSCGGGTGVECCLPVNACHAAGGVCLDVTPDACAHGVVTPAPCGAGAGVECCVLRPQGCEVLCDTVGATRCISGAMETCRVLQNCAPSWGDAQPCVGGGCNSDGTKCIPSGDTCTTDADCGCGCGCGGGACHCTGAIPPTCNEDSDCGPACSGIRCVNNACVPPTCTPGADQTCNEDPGGSAILGTCNADATCTCAMNFFPGPDGRCAPQH